MGLLLGNSGGLGFVGGEKSRFLAFAPFDSPACGGQAPLGRTRGQQGRRDDSAGARGGRVVLVEAAAVDEDAELVGVAGIGGVATALQLAGEGGGVGGDSAGRGVAGASEEADVVVEAGGEVGIVGEAGFFAARAATLKLGGGVDNRATIGAGAGLDAEEVAVATGKRRAA